MDEFKGNSHKGKEEKKEIKQITSGKVVKKEKSLGKKVGQSLLGDDSKDVGSYILHDVLIPALKDTISDMVTGGIEMLLFGKSSNRTRSRGSTSKYGKVNYSSYSSSPSERAGAHKMSNRGRSKHDFDEIVLESRGEAEDVISHLVDLVDDYGMASVADLYDLVGIASSYTDNKYGWTNLSSAGVSRTRNGYLLNLPRTEVID